MLNITKKIEYGLIAMRHINQYGENSLCSSSEIANKYHLPKEIFAKTMQILSKKNYICSVKGPNGGYFLNKSLNQIKLIQFHQPKRSGGETKNNFYTLYDIGVLGIVKHSKLPLRLMTFIGFFTSIASIITAAVFFFYKIIKLMFFK